MNQSQEISKPRRGRPPQSVSLGMIYSESRNLSEENRSRVLKYIKKLIEWEEDGASAEEVSSELEPKPIPE